VKEAKKSIVICTKSLPDRVRSLLRPLEVKIYSVQLNLTIFLLPRDKIKQIVLNDVDGSKIISHLENGGVTSNCVAGAPVRVDVFLEPDKKRGL